MFKKRTLIAVLIGLAWVGSLSGLVVLMSFIEVKKEGVVCHNVKVLIPGNQYFIDKREVDNILQLNSNALIGRKITQVNLHNLENKLKGNPFIESARVFSEMDGEIIVEVSQRQPMMRIMNRYDQDFYVDQHGLKVPLSQNFTARVLAANGYIDELFANRVDTLRTSIAKELFKTVEFINKDSLWSAQIVQVYVNQQHEIELIPRVGSQRILLGRADSLETKFENLKAFYKQALPRVGWDAYKTINIKYANQVIGVKNEHLKADSAAIAASAKRDSIKPAPVVSKIK